MAGGNGYAGWFGLNFSSKHAAIPNIFVKGYETELLGKCLSRCLEDRLIERVGLLLSKKSLNSAIMSRIDKIYRRCIVTNMFTKGWGKPEDMKKIMYYRKKCADREATHTLVPEDYPVYIDKVQDYEERGHRLLDGHFLSPVAIHLPGIMPKEVEIARFQMLVPKVWKKELKPICVHYGGTGDHYFGRRLRLMARPLLEEEGIASVILENPYYGFRKPKQQFRSSLQHVSDLFVMGAGIILESLVLFNWLERLGYGPLGATGISMGGHMASLAATAWHKPISLIPCLSGTSASVVFTEGVLSKAVSWDILKRQFAADIDYSKEITKIIDSPEPGFNNIILKERERWLSKSQRHSYKEKRDMGDVFLTGNNGTMQATATGYNQLLTTYSKNITKKVTDLNKRVVDLKQKKNEKHEELPQLEKDVLLFMKGIMDECTHIKNFPMPVDTELCNVVQAEKDAYYPVKGVMTLEDIWKGCHVQVVPRGHISGFVFERKLFRKAIAESFHLLESKHYR